jgi:hypothetical protein
MNSIYQKIDRQIKAEQAADAENKHRSHWRQSLGNTAQLAIKNLCGVLIDEPERAQAAYRWLNLLWVSFFELQYGEKLKKPPKPDQVD